MKIFKYLLYIVPIFYTSLLYSQTCGNEGENIGLGNGLLKLADVTIVVGDVSTTVDTSNEDDDSPYFQRAIDLYECEGKGGFIVLEESKIYTSESEIMIDNGLGITIQGQGEGKSRSKIVFYRNGTTPGIRITRSDYSGLRNLRLQSLDRDEDPINGIEGNEHKGDVIRVEGTTKTRFHELHFDQIYNGMRFVHHRKPNTNDVRAYLDSLISNIEISEARGKYGFYAIGAKGDVGQGLTFAHIYGNLLKGSEPMITNSNQFFEWLKMGKYTTSFHIIDFVTKGGRSGIVGDSGSLTFPKYIFGTGIVISDTSSDGITLNSGLDVKLTDLSISNTGRHGVNIGKEFSGGLLLSDPNIANAGMHGINISSVERGTEEELKDVGQQFLIFNPLISSSDDAINIEPGIEQVSVQYGKVSSSIGYGVKFKNYPENIAFDDGLSISEHEPFVVTGIDEVMSQDSYGIKRKENEWYFISEDVTEPTTNTPVIGVNGVDGFLSDFNGLMNTAKTFPNSNPDPAASDSNTSFDYAHSFTDLINYLNPTHSSYVCDSTGASRPVIWLTPQKIDMTENIIIKDCPNLTIHGSGKCLSTNACSTIFAKEESNGDGYGVEIINSNNVTINDVNFRTLVSNGHEDFAIKVIKSNDVKIVDNSFVKYGSGVRIDSSDNAIILNNEIKNIPNNDYAVRYGYEIVGQQAITGQQVEKISDNTVIFRTYLSDRSANTEINPGLQLPCKDENDKPVIPCKEDRGFGMATVVKVGAYTKNTKLLQLVSINAGKALHVVDESVVKTNRSTPTNIMAYHIGADHASTEGVLIEDGNNVNLTNLWIGANENMHHLGNCPDPTLPCDIGDFDSVFSGIKVTGGKNIDIGNVYERGYAGHGIQIVDVEGLFLYNFLVGRNSRSASKPTATECLSPVDDNEVSINGGIPFNGIEVERGVEGVVIRGGIAGNLFEHNEDDERQGYGISVEPNESDHKTFLKGVILKDNCFLNTGNSLYGGNGSNDDVFKAHNPGWDNATGN